MLFLKEPKWCEGKYWRWGEGEIFAPPLPMEGRGEFRLSIIRYKTVFGRNGYLIPVRLLWQNTTDWVTYKPQEGSPGGPMAETLRSQCRGPGFHPWSGNLVPHCATKYPACRNKDQRFCVQQLRPSAVKQANKQQEFISQKFRRLRTQRSACQHGPVLVKALLLVHCQQFLMIFHMMKGPWISLGSLS